MLQAMNVPTEYAMGTLRLTVGRFTTEDEVDRAVAEIAEVVGSMTAAGGCGELTRNGNRQNQDLLDYGISRIART